MYSSETPQRARREARHGYSLLELTLVVLILGIMAAAVIPSFISTGPYKLDLAAAEVAQALRYARGESRRTGAHYGVTISQVTHKVSVHKWDITTDPASVELVPYHPVDKRAFEVQVDGLALAPGIEIANASDVFLYDGIGRRRSLIFDPQGLPVWIIGGGSTVKRLLDGTVTLADGESQRSVVVAPLTGRVSVQ